MFSCQYRHFEYNMILFRLANTSTTFQTFINKVLGDLLDTICIAYLDNILIYFKQTEDYTQYVYRVLKQLVQHDLLVNLPKCKFSTDCVTFLGFIVNPASVHIEPNCVKAI